MPKKKEEKIKTPVKTPTLVVSKQRTAKDWIKFYTKALSKGTYPPNECDFWIKHWEAEEKKGN